MNELLRNGGACAGLRLVVHGIRSVQWSLPLASVVCLCLCVCLTHRAMDVFFSRAMTPRALPCQVW